MTPAAKKVQKTRLKIIQAAFELFHKKGINAASVDAILEASGTGKSQFYHYFKNKEDLLHAVVQNLYELDRDKKLPFQYDVNSWRDLEQWFAEFVNFQKSVDCARGCPMATIGYELTSEQELIRQAIHLDLEYRKNSIVKFFHGLKAKGKLKKSVDPDALGDFCYSIVQGGMILAKIRKDIAPFENSVSHAVLYLKSLQI
jgi:AcrR family transcriptional regulator